MAESFFRQLLKNKSYNKETLISSQEAQNLACEIKDDFTSHICLFELPDKPGLKILTDCLSAKKPDLETIIHIAENAAQVFSFFTSKEPKIAFLSANEKISPKLPSTKLASEAAHKLKEEKGLNAEGPLSLDLALSSSSAEIKHYGGSIQGDADILVVPDSHCGKILMETIQLITNIKTAQILYSSKNVSGLIQGHINSPESAAAAIIKEIIERKIKTNV